ncbi:WASH complex, subunit strumpellin, partial [Kipferlia bialata]
AHRAVYGPVLLDYRYLQNSAIYDRQFENDASLVATDEEFRIRHQHTLKRFWTLFQSIHNLGTSLSAYLRQLRDGVFVQQTYDVLIASTGGKQLLGEAIYLNGVALLLLDLMIPGPVRERILVAYYRWADTPPEAVVPVIELMRDTGFRAPRTERAGMKNSKMPYGPLGLYGRVTASLSQENSPGFDPNEWGSGLDDDKEDDGGRVPVNYPVDYLARAAPEQEIVLDVVGALANEDIYQKSRFYPSQTHRGAMLGKQTQILSVLLLFVPDTLRGDVALVREVLGKHCSDCTVIPIYLGICLDLSVVFQSFKAAKEAVAPFVSSQHLQRTLGLYVEGIEHVETRIANHLIEGALTEAYLLDNVSTVLDDIRAANVILRWIFLTRNSKRARLRSDLNEKIDDQRLLRYVLHTAQFEYQVKTIYGAALGDRQKRFNKLKQRVEEKLDELGKYFGTQLSTEGKSEDLARYFGQKLKGTMTEMTLQDPVLAGRRISELLNALSTVTRHHRVGSVIAVSQFLQETRALLSRLLRITNVTKDTRHTIEVVSGFSYCWGSLQSLTPILQDRIKTRPDTVIQLRSLVAKLIAVLEDPVERLALVPSESDIVDRICSFHSESLLGYVQGVLSVVPSSVFALMEGIAGVLDHLNQPRPRVRRTELLGLSQLELRG